MIKVKKVEKGAKSTEHQITLYIRLQSVAIRVKQAVCLQAMSGFQFSGILNIFLSRASYQSVILLPCSLFNLDSNLNIQYSNKYHSGVFNWDLSNPSSRKVVWSQEQFFWSCGLHLSFPPSQVFLFRGKFHKEPLAGTNYSHHPTYIVFLKHYTR